MTASEIRATASKGTRAWAASFDVDGEHFRVHAPQFSLLRDAIRDACDDAGLVVGTVTVTSAYDDAKRGADHATAEAEAAAHTAQEIRRSLVRKMKHDGLTHADIAAILGISHQRVSQLIAAPARARKALDPLT